MCCLPLIVAAGPVVAAAARVAATAGVAAHAGAASKRKRNGRRERQSLDAVLQSIGLFVIAAFAEIGGAWLVWQGVREHRGVVFIGLGIMALAAYGFVATFQPDPHFGRILAAYGGIFVAGSLAWGVVVDGFRPDRWDLLGRRDLPRRRGGDHVRTEGGHPVVVDGSTWPPGTSYTEPGRPDWFWRPSTAGE